ncbi:hypothetical protein NUACC26_028120 [Scytonema sp. NUACC26]
MVGIAHPTTASTSKCWVETVGEQGRRGAGGKEKKLINRLISTQQINLDALLLQKLVMLG